MNPWIVSLRLRTLPLAIAVISLGAALAHNAGQFQWNIYAWALITTICLQILSNLANEYGDYNKGTDNDDRQGPIRSIQSGSITQKSMFRAILVMTALSFLAGLYLLYIASDSSTMFYCFFALGILSIGGAIYYTFGDNAYGYMGLGDISVFVFFGLVGVVGTYYLFAKSIDPFIWLPAISVGLFSTAVLNVNNVRDIDNDRSSGKNTIPVRLGETKAVIYHIVLLFIGIVASIVFAFINHQQLTDWLFLLILPLLIINVINIRRHVGSRSLDPMLKQMVLTTLIYAVLFSAGLLLR